MQDIELNHLKYFYYTVLEGGVTQAANRLCVQQPVVSKMLKSLDDQLGQALFWKKGRNKSLTDFGQLVYRHCQVLFDEVENIKRVAADPQKVTGLFNVGAAEPIINYIFSPILSRLIEKYPYLNFNVYTSTQSHLKSMISNGKLDVGCFFYLPNKSKDLEIVKTVSMPFRLVIKKELSKDKEVIESFIGSREIDDTSTDRFPTVEYIRKKYPKTRITFSSNSITLHKQLVLKGKGISILPEFVVEKELKKGALVDVFPRKKFAWDLKVVKRKSHHLSVAGQAFVASLK